MNKEPEKLLENYKRFISILSKVVDNSSVEKIENQFAERLVLSPRGLKLSEGGYPGALLEFSINVATAASSMSSYFDNKKSLVKVSLLHEIGRLGDLDNDLYINQESEWHRDKLEQHFKYNESCPKMSISHRTLWLCSHLNIALSQSEYLSILTGQGLHLPENQFYGKLNDPIVSGLQASRGIVLSTHN
tara:strand:+ start:296 stop:862 length:567 start_codon:yes stop_codon:yes gene_type:complete